MTKHLLVRTVLFSAIWYSTAASAADPALNVETRIQRVEAGLLGPFVVHGRANPGMSLTERMRFYQVPGVSVAVINNGAIEWARGYGVLDARSKVAVTPDSLFQAASISKPVFSMAVLSLVQQGALSLDEDVNIKLKSWKMPENEFTKERKLTLRSLLNHTGGTTVSGFRGYATGAAVPTLLQLLDGAAPANSAAVRVDKAPGGAIRYSGGGMTVAQLLVSDVSAQPFAPFMKATVFDPLGMKHSSFEQPLPAEMADSAATAHDGTGVPIKGKWHTYPEQAAAGLWSTPSDLARFAIELQKSRAGVSDAVLSTDMATQMLTNSKASPFGLGIEVSAPEKVRSFTHSGGNEGFRAMLFAYTETGKGAVVMTNGSRGLEFIDELMRSIAKEYGWSDFQVAEQTFVKVDARILATYAGQFMIRGTRAEISFDGSRLFLKAAPLGREAREVFPESDTKFFLPAPLTLLAFEKDENGVVNLEVTFQGKKVKAVRIE